MEKKVEELIGRDDRELEFLVAHNAFLPQRLKRHLAGRPQRSRRAAPRRIFPLVSLYGLIFVLLTFLHLAWIPRPGKNVPVPAQNLALNPHPPELENTITRAFLEVVRWGD